MFGLTSGKYWLMILGRVVFGFGTQQLHQDQLTFILCVGGENLGVAQSVVIS